MTGRTARLSRAGRMLLALMTLLVLGSLSGEAASGRPAARAGAPAVHDSYAGAHIADLARREAALSFAAANTARVTAAANAAQVEQRRAMARARAAAKQRAAQAAHDPSRTATAAGTPSVPPPAPARTAGQNQHPTSRKAPVAAPKPHPAPRPVATGTDQSSIAWTVLATLNAERRAHGARTLRMNGELISSAHRHNLAMASADRMSHQLPGEPYFTTRISDAGYDWQAAGENIGWNSDMSTGGALQLEYDMYAEGPGGGHYQNIVSTRFTDVGIDVWFDNVHHTLWLTEDFGEPA